MRIGGMRTLAIGVAMTTSLIACSSDDTSSATTPASTSTSSSEAESPSAVADATVQLADSDLGQILVASDGMTLYLFEVDEGDTSTCYDDCAATWPALVDDAPTAGDGVDESLLGTTERDDGDVQVTYAGHPLYFYAPDEAPGDTLGQEVGDVWYVVDAEGAAVG
jgi:predicted lipoprotein with Yx(FWY)xxD motif